MDGAPASDEAAAPSIALDAIGMPGCALPLTRVVASQLATRVAGSGAARLSFSVPADPTLSGLQFWMKAAWADSAANALGLALSNGSTVIVR